MLGWVEAVMADAAALNFKSFEVMALTKDESSQLKVNHHLGAGLGRSCDGGCCSAT